MNTNWKNQVTENYEEIAKYNVLGLRAIRPDEKYQVGDYARNSYDWDAENDCSSEEELNGTCSISFDVSWLEGAADLINRIEETISEVRKYYGDGIVLLGGWASSDGTDSGEQVIENAKVLAVLE